MLKKIVAGTMLALPLACAAAGPKGVVPLDEQEFLAQYGNVAKQVAPRVYEIAQKGHTRSVAFGLDGLRYRVAQFEQLSASDAKGTFAQLARELRNELAEAERSVAAKNSESIPSYCGVDGQLDANYYPTMYGSFATAGASASLSGFGPQPEGPITIRARAWRETTAGWQLIDEQAATLSTYETYSVGAAASGGGTCANVGSMSNLEMPAYPGSECNMSVWDAGACF